MPINIVKPIIKSFEDNNSFIEAKLGIYAYDKEIIKYVNSRIMIEKGIYVVKVNEKSAAKEAGLKVGDIIISIDGSLVNKMTELRRIIYAKKQGDVLDVIISRQNRIKSIMVKLK